MSRAVTCHVSTDGYLQEDCINPWRRTVKIISDPNFVAGFCPNYPEKEVDASGSGGNKPSCKMSLTCALLL